MFLTAQHAQSIVDELKKAIRQDINIMDATGRIMASTNPQRIGTIHQGAVQILENKLPLLIIRENDPSLGVQKGINLPIVLDQEIAGIIGITGEPDEVSVFGDIIKRMTEVMVTNRFYREQSALADQAKTLFLENWLFAAAPDWNELQLQGRFLGFDIHASYTVVLLEIADNDTPVAALNPRVLQTLRSGLRDDPRHFCTLLRGRFTLLLHQVDRQDAQQRIGKLCRDIESYYDTTVGAGISRPSQTSTQLRRCYQEAQTAAAAARTGKRQVVIYDETSLEFLIQSIPASIRSDLQASVFAACTDKETEDFRRIISLYFEKDGDIRACADQLYVHRNTFQYRMDQLKKKTGYDLKSPGDAAILLASICR